MPLSCCHHKGLTEITERTERRRYAGSPAGAVGDGRATHSKSLKNLFRKLFSMSSDKSFHYEGKGSKAIVNYPLGRRTLLQTRDARRSEQVRADPSRIINCQLGSLLLRGVFGWYRKSTLTLLEKRGRVDCLNLVLRIA